MGTLGILGGEDSGVPGLAQKVGGLAGLSLRAWTCLEAGGVPQKCGGKLRTPGVGAARSTEAHWEVAQAVPGPWQLPEVGWGTWRAGSVLGEGVIG